MKKCEKNGVPLIIHIHSGKFDTFCARNAGKSVERELSKAGRKTVVLEERWLNRLSPWILVILKFCIIFLAQSQDLVIMCLQEN